MRYYEIEAGYQARIRGILKRSRSLWLSWIFWETSLGARNEDRQRPSAGTKQMRRKATDCGRSHFSFTTIVTTFLDSMETGKMNDKIVINKITGSAEAIATRANRSEKCILPQSNRCRGAFKPFRVRPVSTSGNTLKVFVKRSSPPKTRPVPQALMSKQIRRPSTSAANSYTAERSRLQIYYRALGGWITVNSWILLWYIFFSSVFV